jgi:type I restriction enzyme S subunit
MGHIQRHHLHEAQVVVLDEATLRHLDDVIAPLMFRMVATRLESRTLVQLRDTVMPKLLSGELGVCAAEKELAAHV